MFHINNANYKTALDRFDELWSANSLLKNEEEEIEILADLISAYEERNYSQFNNPTYRDLLNERKQRKNGRV